MKDAHEPQLRSRQQQMNFAKRLHCLSRSSVDSPATFTARVSKRAAPARAQVRENKQTK
jgi:hypothetical protein